MTKTKDKYAAQKKYEAKNIKRISMKLNKTTDRDILAALNSAEPAATQLKRLIRSGLSKNI